jgi:AraC family transcriptional regulator
MEVPAGGGAFTLPRLTVGLFLVGQDGHRLALGSDRKRHIPLAAGEGWILPPDSDGVCEFDAPHSYATLELTDSLLIDAGFDTARGFAPAVGKLDPLLAEFVRNAATAGEAPALYRDTMDLAAAAHLARLLQPQPPAGADIADRRLRRVLAYIGDNLAKDMSLDALASEAAMSRYHFARAFAKAVGRSPLQYVIGQRMELARTMLRARHAPVAEIALSVGYGDVSRFSRHFRRHVGVTPAAFRKQ